MLELLSYSSLNSPFTYLASTPYLSTILHRLVLPS